MYSVMIGVLGAIAPQLVAATFDDVGLRLLCQDRLDGTLDRCILFRPSGSGYMQAE